MAIIFDPNESRDRRMQLLLQTAATASQMQASKLENEKNQILIDNLRKTQSAYGNAVPGQAVTPAQGGTTPALPSQQPGSLFNATSGFAPVTTYEGIDASTGLPKLKTDVDLPKEQATRAMSLRSEFRQNPIVKDYQDTLSKVNSMDSLLKAAESGDLKGKNALDQGLINFYNKISDPLSVVRESEYARTSSGLSLMNRLSGLQEKLFSTGGAGLTDADRKELVIAAKIIADERGNAFNTQFDDYLSLGNDFAVPTKALERGYKKHEQLFKINKDEIIPDDVAPIAQEAIKKYGDAIAGMRVINNKKGKK